MNRFFDGGTVFGMPYAFVAFAGVALFVLYRKFVRPSDGAGMAPKAGELSVQLPIHFHI